MAVTFGDVPLLDPVTGKFPSAFDSPTVAINADRAEAAAAEAAGHVDTFTAPAKDVLDTIMGGDVAGLVTKLPSVYIDTNYASLQAAITACPTGATLEVRGTHTSAVTINVTKAMTLRFVGGSITCTSDAATALAVQANNVTIVDPQITGTGGNVGSTLARGISVTDSTDFALVGGLIKDVPLYGLSLSHCSKVTISAATIRDIGYAAIMLLSCEDVAITEMAITDLHQPGSWVNSYGIAITHLDTDPLISRSKKVTISRCRITNVPAWEGIDSHAGDHVTIVGCTVINCAVGIAMVPGGDTVAKYWAPKNLSITGNTVDGQGTGRIGIQLAGTGDGVGLLKEGANGIVSGNMISGTTEAAILAQYTEGMVVTGNTLKEPKLYGIDIYHTNVGLVVSNNSIIDSWTDTASGAAVQVRSDYNKVVVGANAVRRGTRAGTVNGYGLRIISSYTNNQIVDVGGNDWSLATVPIVGAALRMLTSFYGTTPVVKPTVTGAKGSNAALASLLTALAAVGLITDSSTT